MVVLSEYRRLRERVIPQAREAVLNGLIAIGVSHGPRGVRQLRDRLLAEFGDPDDRERAAARAAREVALSQPVAGDVDGVWDYVLRVDAEAKAILEAAIGPLSAPMHTDQERDPRSTSQRRGQALIEVCRRVSAMATAAGPYGRRPSDEPSDEPSGGSSTGDATARPVPAAGGHRRPTGAARRTTMRAASRQRPRRRARARRISGDRTRQRPAAGGRRRRSSECADAAERQPGAAGRAAGLRWDDDVPGPAHAEQTPAGQATLLPATLKRTTRR